MTKEIKCVVWDLDETLWDGTLLESEQVRLKPGMKEILHTLDERGILQSVCSKNDYNHAMTALKERGLDHLFIYPQIGWDAKSILIGNIQRELNIGFDSILFIDDQMFELDEVNSVHPDIFCMQTIDRRAFLDIAELNPKFITVDSARRRSMYMDDMQRKQDEQTYNGPKEQFLSQLNMEFMISPATEEDLARASELTVRTHQLNATGVTYDHDELNRFRQSDSHRLYLCELTDKYGTYGKIGLVLAEITDTHWHLKLLLMSCRVMSRGVGTILLSFMMDQAKQDGKKMLADFRKTDRNKMMYITYRFANFKEIDVREDGELLLLENDLSVVQKYPEYIRIIVKER